jgi:type IV secretion system protein VirB8
LRGTLEAHQPTGPDVEHRRDAGDWGATMRRDPELAGYFSEAATWDADARAQGRRTTRLALGVAGAGWIAVLALAAALMLLMPLKHVEPFVVRVDNATGIVDVVPVYRGGSGVQEAMTRYLLTHYVTVCERFNYATAESDYEECGAFHTAQRNQAWYALWNPTNPNSPLNAYKDGTTIRAQVSSVSFFKRASGVADLAQVRYAKAKRAAGAANEETTHWIATIQYVYSDPSTDPKVRGWNPLGFKVVDFRPEPEVLPDTAVPATSALATSPAGGSRPGGSP